MSYYYRSRTYALEENNKIQTSKTLKIKTHFYHAETTTVNTLVHIILGHFLHMY